MTRAAGQGPASNDPLRCGLNSAHPTFAMRNLLQFANSLRECTMLPCFCIAWHSHVLPCRFRAASLRVAWCHGWVGWGTKIFCRPCLPSGRLLMQPAALKAA